MESLRYKNLLFPKLFSSLNPIDLFKFLCIPFIYLLFQKPLNFTHTHICIHKPTYKKRIGRITIHHLCMLVELENRNICQPSEQKPIFSSQWSMMNRSSSNKRVKIAHIAKFSYKSFIFWVEGAMLITFYLSFRTVIYKEFVQIYIDFMIQLIDVRLIFRLESSTLKNHCNSHHQSHCLLSFWAMSNFMTDEQ